MVYKVSPGKAYVKGYEVDRRVPALFDVQKPRNVKTLTAQSINFGFGPSFTINNVTGSPIIGFNTSATLSLRDERVGSNGQPSHNHYAPNGNIDGGHIGAPGKEIGVCRIYDFALELSLIHISEPTRPY